MFQPIALEMLGSVNESATHFLEDLGRSIAAVSNEEREGIFLLQRLSMLLQHFNAILLHDTFAQWRIGPLVIPVTFNSWFCFYFSQFHGIKNNNNHFYCNWCLFHGQLLVVCCVLDVLIYWDECSSLHRDKISLQKLVFHDSTMLSSVLNMLTLAFLVINVNSVIVNIIVNIKK